MTTTSMLPDVGIELREGYAQVGDVNLHYVEAGDGPLIVLLHGFPEFWFGWRLQIAPLAAAGFRVVAPDTRGYNLSSKPEDFEAYAVDLLAADIRGLIGELGAESALLVGHDWGGSIAWTTAMNHPEVVDRLAILNAAHPRRLSQGLNHPSQLRKSWYFFFFALPGLPEDVVHARDWHFFRHFLDDANPPYTPEEIERYVEAWSQPGAAAAMINYYRASVRQSQKEAAAKLRPISAPTLVIWGEQDSYLGSDLAEPERDDVPNLDRVERLPDASHWVHHDEAERVNQLLIDFFAPAEEVVMSTTAQTATDIRPFHVDTPEEKLAELRRRIAATRLPSGELVADRSQGVQLATIQELARYWETDYDWRKAEVKLNALPQFTTEIDGVDIHFIHVKSSHENALPLIMTHGWPGSVMEMIDSVGPLTDPTAHGGSAEDAFHLVLPSLPGYGFSGEPVEVGWDLGRTARAWAELMRRLGYTRYVAQGGDVGAGVTDAMGRQAPEGLIGIHTNLLVPALSGTMPTDTDEERAAAAQIATFGQSGNGYFVEMATRPQTIGYALLDSPVALAAWMIDHDTDSLLQDLPRLRRRAAFGQPHPGQRPRQHHGLLADRHRRLRGPVVLGGLRAGRAGRGPPAAAAAADPGRLHDVPRRDLADSAQLGREVVPQRHLLQRSRPGRPLRRVGRAGALRNRGARGFQVIALIGACERHGEDEARETDTPGSCRDPDNPWEPDARTPSRRKHEYGFDNT